MKYYAGIGSRKTPQDILELMKEIAVYLANMGYTLISGGADGADSAFEQGCDSVNGPKIIYIPWNGFNGRYASDSVYIGYPDNRAYAIAAKYHPYWDNCSAGAKALHARNVYQILDHDFAPRVHRVVCWTPDGATRTTTAATGGTGQAIRIAAAHGIQVFNLANKKTRESVERKINGQD